MSEDYGIGDAHGTTGGNFEEIGVGVTKESVLHEIRVLNPSPA